MSGSLPFTSPCLSFSWPCPCLSCSVRPSRSHGNKAGPANKIAFPIKALVSNTSKANAPHTGNPPARCGRCCARSPWRLRPTRPPPSPRHPCPCRRLRQTWRTCPSCPICPPCHLLDKIRPLKMISVNQKKSTNLTNPCSLYVLAFLFCCGTGCRLDHCGRGTDLTGHRIIF